MEDYTTILESTETEIEIKKSRFLNFVFHVENEAEVEAVLSELRKKHYKATHICWAYVLNTIPLRQKATDDGEPAGTAGKPILEVINHKELKDVLVVVIRYFGGIKLGTGGLVRAYGGGASDVIKAAQVIKKQFSSQIYIEIAYPLYGGLINQLTEKKWLPVEEDFADKVTLFFQIPAAEAKEFLAWITEETNGQFEHTEDEPEYVNVRLKDC
ncbi:YigZ family protein [Eubacteriaceae bacterium ES3]|nr:YigZ family protein [Eubacteriaceae bacterium ES3]